MSAVAIVEEAAEQLPAPASETTAIIQMIERAAMNPAVDIDKMERLFEMRERIAIREARTSYYGAMAAMQPGLPVISRRGTIKVPAKDGKTGHETPYALWEDINEAIRPLLAEHGFALSFRVKKEADRVEITGVLSHRDGHAEETMLSLPMDSTGSKNNVQAIGSSVSYGKRYTAGALLNFTTHGEDDDGKTGGAPSQQFVTEDQAATIQATMEEVKADRDGFLKYMKADSIAAIKAKDYDRAISALNKKRGVL
jgi:hypothetical protein